MSKGIETRLSEPTEQVVAEHSAEYLALLPAPRILRHPAGYREARSGQRMERSDPPVCLQEHGHHHPGLPGSQQATRVLRNLFHFATCPRHASQRPGHKGVANLPQKLGNVQFARRIRQTDILSAAPVLV